MKIHRCPGCRSVRLAAIFLLGVNLVLSGCSPTLNLVPENVSATMVPPTTEALPTKDLNGLKVLRHGQTPPAYSIGPGDEVVISVWGRPDLGSQIPAEGDNRRNQG